MIIRSRAPLRIGLAGGGTDVAPYCDIYGGNVFNSTISLSAYCTIEPTNDGKIYLLATDRDEHIIIDAEPQIAIEEPFLLFRGVYNRIVKDFNKNKPLSLKIITCADAPSGSGLGTSSTMVVAILEAFCKWLKLDLNKYQKAKLAYEIEREDLKLAGGKQDQYAATFGGFNFIEFNKDNVIVNPLKMPKNIVNELECSLLMYYCGQSRDSAKVISEQIKNTESKNSKTIEAFHNIKEMAKTIKDNILLGNFDNFANNMRESWENKKKTSSMVSNSFIEENVEYAMRNGAKAVKVSGAGGGGFLLMYCNPIDRQKLFEKMKQRELGTVYPVSFVPNGVESWIIR